MSSGGGTSSLGGTAGDGGTLDECPSEQWECADWSSCCSYDGYFSWPEGCVCNPSRPKTSSDCTADEVLACPATSADHAGKPLPEPMPVSCACKPKPSLPSCSGACSPGSICSEINGPKADLATYLCGCAVAILK